jgi:ferredoxin-NADP reductase
MTPLGSAVPMMNYARPTKSHTIQSQPTTTSGITVYIQRNNGITAALHSHPSPIIKALLEGPYPNTSSQPVLSTDRLILFAGGIGITGVLPFVHSHPNVKLYWSVRLGQEALVDELERTIPGQVERSIIVGGRNDVYEALLEEVKARWELVGVVVCGPGRLCDDVRNKVSGMGRTYRTRFELDVEAFLW